MLNRVKCLLAWSRIGMASSTSPSHSKRASATPFAGRKGDETGAGGGTTGVASTVVIGTGVTVWPTSLRVSLHSVVHESCKGTCSPLLAGAACAPKDAPLTPATEFKELSVLAFFRGGAAWLAISGSRMPWGTPWCRGVRAQPATEAWKPDSRGLLDPRRTYIYLDKFH